mmetsp:Transcript_30416/g.50526  ORF Transcript_30416/g.50526 Transcript_30416/m.50526 type:complete len:112 (-) Transcript_30416:164-499(-)
MGTNSFRKILLSGEVVTRSQPRGMMKDRKHFWVACARQERISLYCILLQSHVHAKSRMEQTIKITSYVSATYWGGQLFYCIVGFHITKLHIGKEAISFVSSPLSNLMGSLS